MSATPTTRTRAEEQSRINELRRRRLIDQQQWSILTDELSNPIAWSGAGRVKGPAETKCKEKLDGILPELCFEIAALGHFQGTTKLLLAVLLGEERAEELEEKLTIRCIEVAGRIQTAIRKQHRTE